MSLNLASNTTQNIAEETNNLNIKVVNVIKPSPLKNKKHMKLMEAYLNNVEISNKNLGDKYIRFEDSKLDESRTLLYEIENTPKNYKRYFRGEIVRVKFGVNIGSEFSGDHFAIVISKGDTMMNSTLHVIPLTSKKHLKSVNVGNVLYNEKEIEKLKVKLCEETDYSRKKQIQKVIRYYELRKNITTYACIDHIKTVSKLSVKKPFFKEYDYLASIKCSEELLEKLDNCIIKEYTNLRK